MQKRFDSTVTRRGFIAGAALLTGGALLNAGCTPASKAGEALPGTGQDAAAQVAGTGSAAGRNGELTVRVVMDGDQLADIHVIRSHESLSVGQTAQDMLHELILENQTLNIDTVSGATLTSMAYLSAVEEALEDAGVDASEWASRSHATVQRENPIPAEADVVVLGSGIAGLCAATTAAKAGKSVVVLEKMGILGGSSAYSGATFAAPGHWLQKHYGIEDSADALAEDMLKGGDNEGDPALVHTLCDNALDSIEWLTYEIGVAWWPGGAPGLEGGHSVARSISPLESGGGVVRDLITGSRDSGVDLQSSVKAESLIKDGSNAVVGVRYTDQITGDEGEIATTAVVIATGGLGRNVEMRTKYCPELVESYLCTDAPGITGDGMAMAEEAGAELVDMSFIQTHPTGNPVNGSMLDAGGMRSSGCALMVNKEGVRFVEELDRRDVMSKAILAQTDGLGYFVFERKAADDWGMFDWDIDEINTMTDNGYWAEGKTLEEACAAFGIDAKAVAEEIETWNADCKTGKDSRFGYRGEMFPIGEGPYCIFATTPTIHYSMGGISIDQDARVLTSDKTPIPGLFAAGETTGNIMGTNRLGTTAVLDCTVFGRIAGTSAANA